MSAGKEIKAQISSIKNTAKITKAMEMVATSKMRKCQQRMEKNRPYSETIMQIISDLSQANSEISHPWMRASTDEVEGVGYIVVSTDRGLCGGLNSYLFKEVVSHMRQSDSTKVSNVFSVFGTRGKNFFSRAGGNVISSKIQLGDLPIVSELLDTIRVMLDLFRENKVQRVMLCYNKLVNTMVQEPVVAQILPLPELYKIERSYSWDYIYEPNAYEILDKLLPRYLESLIYQSVLSNVACEQAARMVAMKSATDNAGNLIDELELVYNKARQAAITQEISEIVGGAAAV